MTLKTVKKQLFFLFAIFAFNEAQAVIGSALLENISKRVPSSIQRVLKSKPVLAVGAALAVGAVAYKPYRLLQQYLRSRAIAGLKEAAQQGQQEQILEHPNIETKTLFAHGLGGEGTNCYYYKDADVFHDDVNIEKPQFKRNLMHFNFQDTWYEGNKPSCLAQDADINALKDWYDASVRENHKVILYGLSRGAATVLNFLAIHKPKNVACAVLESPFDDLETIVQDQLKSFGIGYIPGLGTLASACITPIVTLYPRLLNHTVFGVYPKDVVHEIPHDIPLMFISSKQDSLIPQSSTQNIVDIIKKSGHPQYHNIICNVGGHAGVTLSNNQACKKAKAFMSDPEAFIRSQQSDTTVI